MFACCHFYFRLQLLFIIIHITCISLSLYRTSAPIHLTIVLRVLGTQETSRILIAGLLERDIFDLNLPDFDKPWVIHLRETYFDDSMPPIYDDYNIFSPPTIEEKINYDYNMPPIFDDYGDENNNDGYFG